jgi:hypothetical protein
LARGQNNPLPMLLRGAEPLLVEHTHSSKGWSPTRRAHGRPSAGTASTPRSLTPRNRFGRERLAQRLRLEAYILPPRSGRCPSDCVGGGKTTNMCLVCGCVGWVADEKKGCRGNLLRTKPEAQLDRALSKTLKILPPNAPVSCLSLSGHSAQQSTCGSRYSDVC